MLRTHQVCGCIHSHQHGGTHIFRLSTRDRAGIARKVGDCAEISDFMVESRSGRVCCTRLLVPKMSTKVNVYHLQTQLKQQETTRSMAVCPSGRRRSFIYKRRSIAPMIQAM
jgi:hypothetical protein